MELLIDFDEFFAAVADHVGHSLKVLTNDFTNESMVGAAIRFTEGGFALCPFSLFNFFSFRHSLDSVAVIGQ